MRLLSLSLQNFKGIREFELDTGGGDVNVFGENGSGKTTLFDAFKWLLFGKDSLDRKEFGIKPLWADDPVETSVTAVITLGGSGQEISLKKVLKEVWSKPKGKSTKEFKGNTTVCYVDDVEAKPKEFQAYIDDLIPEERFKLLTDLRYFNDVLHWTKRRDILFKDFSDVSDADVIASNDELKELPDIIGSYTITGSHSIEDYKPVIRDRAKPMIKQRESIPARIDELKKLIREPSWEQYKLSDLHAERKKLMQEIAGLESGLRDASKQKELGEIRGQINICISQQESKIRGEIRGLRSNLDRDESGLKTIRDGIKSLERDTELNTTEINELTGEVARLRHEWVEENGKVFNAAECSYCGQPLPKDKLKEAEEAFHTAKVEKQAKIKEEADKNKKLISELQEKNKAYAEERQNMSAEIIKLETSIKGWNEDIKSLESILANIDTIPEVQDLRDREDAILKHLEALRGNNGAGIDTAKKSLAEVEEKISKEESRQAIVKQNTESNDRIKELQTEEKGLSKKLEKLDYDAYMIDTFIRTKTAMLEEGINSKFEWVSFRLFKPLQGGGVEDCCEVISKADGTPYHDLSNSERIRAGLDVIRTLSKHYGQTCPVFIDNKETISVLPEMDSQIINLIVSAGDTELRVEKL